MTNTSFSYRQLCEKDTLEGNKHFSHIEQMEEACWNGLLNEFLPDVIDKDAKGKSLLLREIKQCDAFLEIDLCDSPEETDDYYSIDPYVFLSEGSLN